MVAMRSIRMGGIEVAVDVAVAVVHVALGRYIAVKLSHAVMMHSVDVSMALLVDVRFVSRYHYDVAVG